MSPSSTQSHLMMIWCFRLSVMRTPGPWPRLTTRHQSWYWSELCWYQILIWISLPHFPTLCTWCRPRATSWSSLNLALNEAFDWDFSHSINLKDSLPPKDNILIHYYTRLFDKPTSYVTARGNVTQCSRWSQWSRTRIWDQLIVITIIPPQICRKRQISQNIKIAGCKVTSGANGKKVTLPLHFLLHL